MEPFGQLLRNTRKAAGLGLREVAEMLHVSTSYVSDVEHGRRPALTPARIEALADLLHVDPAPLHKAARLARKQGYVLRLEDITDLHHEVGAKLETQWAGLSAKQLRRILGAL